MEMGLQRSQQTFRRSGSSGLVWEERFISGDLGRAGTAPGDEEEEEEEEAQAHAQRRRQGSGRGAGSELRRSQSAGSSGGQPWQRGGGGGNDVVEGGFRAGAVAPAADPPSPDVHGCAFCGILGGGKSKPPGKRSARPRRR